MSGSPAMARPMQDPETLRRLPKRAWIVAAILAPAILATVYLVVTQTRTTRMSDVARNALPTMLREEERLWTSADLALSDREMDILETRDYVFRTYDDGMEPPVDLCVVFSEDNRKGTHPPDVCLEGGGSRIVEHSERRVAAEDISLPIRELVTRSRGKSTYFCYFYKCGESYTNSFYEQQAKIIWYGLLHRNADGALIRFSTPIDEANGGLEAARQRTDRLLRATFPYIRSRLSAR